jgi:hypothetical protein
MKKFVLRFAIGLSLTVIAPTAMFAIDPSEQSILLPTDTLVQDSTLLVDSLQGLQKETRAERRKREKEEQELQTKPIIEKDSTRLAIENISRIAWRRSMFVPGWGQITNGGYWWLKVPVIYGGLVSAGLVFEFNNRYYHEVLGEVQYRLANNHAVPPNSKYTHLDASEFSTQVMINAKDSYRRNRDLTVLVTIGWWGLNMIEAYVDSMLKYRWDLNEDLGFKIQPTLLTPSNGQFAFIPTAGFKATFTIK